MKNDMYDFDFDTVWDSAPDIAVITPDVAPEHNWSEEYEKELTIIFGD